MPGLPPGKGGFVDGGCLGGRILDDASAPHGTTDDPSGNQHPMSAGPCAKCYAVAAFRSPERQVGGMSMRRTTTLLGLVGVFLVGAGGSVAQAQTGAEVTFTDHIRPIFERSCWNCHGEASQLSELDLRTREAAVEGGVRGPALVPGRAEDSRLFRMLAGLDDPPMPMAGDPLSDARAHGHPHLDRRRRALGRGWGHERRRRPGRAREHPAARRGARLLGVQAAEEGAGAPPRPTTSIPSTASSTPPARRRG